MRLLVVLLVVALAVALAPAAEGGGPRRAVDPGCGDGVCITTGGPAALSSFVPARLGLR